METYNKRALTFKEQLVQLKSRGLIIHDEPRAIHYLTHINYYRLSAYMYPLLADKKNHIFKAGTTFQSILDLYNFDRELRLIILDAIERLEISFRTNIIYVLSHKYDPFWINNPDLFYDKEKHSKNIESLKEEINRSREQFLQHFREKYTNEIPAAWITLEIASFGLLSLLFNNLKNNKDMKEISNRYGLNKIVFSSWLHSINYVRNICAHHARLWNRELGVQPNIPKSISGLWLSNIGEIKNDRIFYIISIILYFLSIINPTSHFKNKLLTLFKNYPMIDLASMGFPINWDKEKLFN